jgi:hypothetical protein
LFPLAKINYKKGGITLINLETEILDKLTKRMNSIREKVLICNAKYGTLSKHLRKETFKIMTLYDNFEKDFKDQVDILIDSGCDYQFIKMTLEKRFNV